MSKREIESGLPATARKDPGPSVPPPVFKNTPILFRV
jgi:hypothetical protein